MLGKADRVTGRVWLVGAGPGDPELVTLKAVRALAGCDVIVHDRLVHPSILDHAPAHAERIYAGKRRADHFMRQSEINALLVNRARRGQRVVRLKGGDPLIFGRGGEEIEALIEAGVPFEVVPGVTAAAGCAASAAIPLTHRELAKTLVLVTGHTKDGEPDLDFTALCRPGQTIVFYMGHQALGRLCARLIEGGLHPDLPAALVVEGTLPGQRVIRATLATLAPASDGVTLDVPALVIVGDVVGALAGVGPTTAPVSPDERLDALGPPRG